MTNEEAIKFLSQIMDAILASNSWLPSTDNPIKESFGMAINALKAQEKSQEVSNNSPELDKENGELISRQDAIEHLKKRLYESALNNDGIASYTFEEIADNRIQIWMDELLPSPSRPHGQWIKEKMWSDGIGMGESYGFYYSCSECKTVVKGDYDECGKNFCPQCGADMRP